jgi:hypothetical protein
MRELVLELAVLGKLTAQSSDDALDPTRIATCRSICRP